MPKQEITMTYGTNKRRFRPLLNLGLAVAITAGVSGCDDYFEVVNPNIVDNDTVDRIVYANEFSRSAYQTLLAAYGDMVLYTGWFSNEAWVGDTFPTRNEYGRRLVDDRNGTHNGVWFGLVRGIAQAEEVLEVLAQEQGHELNLARAAYTSGYALTLMGEAFCSGTMRQAGGEPGPEMQPDEIFTVAVARFQQAEQHAAAASGSEAASLEQAAVVGRARALLNLGDNPGAATAAGEVDADFVHNGVYVDQADSRGRLGNGLYFYSFGGSRESLVVPEEYRAIGQDLTDEPENPTGDPRIQFIDAEKDAQDGVLRFWSQMKYPSWDAAIPMASGLEARYIALEATGTDLERIAFIDERRTVGGHGPFVSVDGDEILRELLWQKSIDFWLQGTRMGDWRRNGEDLMTNILPEGNNYYKPAVGTVSNQTCLPLPFAERNANPNIN
jgi:starch-binding outer membrane protein, SusD/RagB family